MRNTAKSMNSTEKSNIKDKPKVNRQTKTNKNSKIQTQSPSKQPIRPIKGLRNKTTILILFKTIYSKTGTQIISKDIIKKKIHRTNSKPIIKNLRESKTNGLIRKSNSNGVVSKRDTKLKQKNSRNLANNNKIFFSAKGKAINFQRNSTELQKKVKDYNTNQKLIL